MKKFALAGSLLLLGIFSLAAQNAGEEPSSVMENELIYDKNGYLTGDYWWYFEGSPMFFLDGVFSDSLDFRLNLDLSSAIRKYYRQRPVDAVTDATTFEQYFDSLVYSQFAGVNIYIDNDEDEFAFSVKPSYTFVKYTANIEVGIDTDISIDLENDRMETPVDSRIGMSIGIGGSYRVRNIENPDRDSGSVTIFGTNGSLRIRNILNKNSVPSIYINIGPEFEYRIYESLDAYFYVSTSLNINTPFYIDEHIDFFSPDDVGIGIPFYIGYSFSSDWQKKYRYIRE